MTDLTERLDAIQARVDAATPGPWTAEPYHVHDPEYGRVRVTSPSDNGLYNTAEALLPTDAEFIAAAPSDVAFLLDLARKQGAVIEAVERLAIGWTLRGESDMAFSKTLPDEDIAMEILTNGAQMVENARHIRNALEGWR